MVSLPPRPLKMNVRSAWVPVSAMLWFPVKVSAAAVPISFSKLLIVSVPMLAPVALTLRVTVTAPALAL